MTLLIGIFALWVAFMLSRGSGEQLFRNMVTLFSIATAPVAVPMLLGLVSRKVTNLSAIVGFVCGLAAGLTIFVCFYGFQFGGGSPGGIAKGAEADASPPKVKLTTFGPVEFRLLPPVVEEEADAEPEAAEAAEQEERGFSIGPFFGKDEHGKETEDQLFSGVVWNPSKDELVFGTVRLKMEVFLFAVNTLVTLIAMLVVILVKPIEAEEQKRADAFQERLAAPIGKFPEDQAAAAGGLAIVSPFRVVGISTLLIGVMMLAILYWVWDKDDQLAFYLDILLGGILVVIGGLMTLYSGSAKQQEPSSEPPPAEDKAAD
jgi:hypothetical protein